MAVRLAEPSARRPATHLRWAPRKRSGLELAAGEGYRNVEPFSWLGGE